MCVFVRLGIEKVCLIGGELFLCCDFIDIIVVVWENDVICQIVVIINGYCLECDVVSWCDVGFIGINVSVDSLDVCQFYVIIGQDKFNQVMVGIDVVFEVGFEKVKVNIVLMCDVNYYQFDIFLNWIQYCFIQLCFIELMEMGEGSEFFCKYYIFGQVLCDELLCCGWIY